MINKELLELLDKIKIIHEKKAADYTSGENHYENFERCALVSDWFRKPIDRVFSTLITVKLARLASLLGKEGKPNNESIEDTFLDLTTYCAIWSSYHDSKRPNITNKIESAWCTNCGQYYNIALLGTYCKICAHLISRRDV